MNEPHDYPKQPYLIHEDSTGCKVSSGFGVCFNYKGRMCRVAVRLSEDAGMGEFRRGWQALEAAMANPDAPESRAAFGDDRLVGNEIVIKTLENKA